MLWIVLTACSQKLDAQIDDTGEDPLILPTSGCGLDAYSFLPKDEMGEILSIDHRPELSLSAEAIETLSSNFSLPLPPPLYSVQTYYIQYRTQDKGQEVEATGIISLPEREDVDLPILLWEHPTMGFADECSPSAIGVVGAAYPILFASLGMAVVAPDYLGMRGWRGRSDTLHPYIVAEPTAIASLDSLRALVRTIEREDLSLGVDSQNVVIWGASEGGYAALMSDRYLPYYAPEFSSVATVATIPATDPLALAKHAVQIFGPTTAGILGAQVTHNQWYMGERSLDEIMNPELASVIEETMFSQCGDFAVFDGMETTADIFQSAYIDGILAEDFYPWTCYLEEYSIVHTPVSFVQAAPTLIITAEEDDLAIAAPVHDDIETLCSLGYRIEHRQCAGLGHVEGGVDTIGLQWEWIERQLRGEDIQDVCIVQDPQECVFE